ncbi:arginine/serine-rich protein PNISR-like [Anopheles stephensi]|uniref:arginine/serine-rich protein PNISR-like n=1 Tax=Anopheles stephensi TaxID=30069 RepID=UPI0007D519F0|nr:arginine/serine-rich protein PNISR-like [Anopheles stephensi]
MMNRHGASNSTRSEDPGQLFSALMSDSGPNQGTFVPGSNAFSLSHYQNMPNDQVDWAALAQQWIKMRETWIQPMPSLIPSPPPPPSFDRDTYDDAAGGDAPHPANRTGPVPEYEEQGEAPMEVEREDDGDMPLPPAPPKISADWPTASGDDTWQTWSWPSSVNSASTSGENHHLPQTLPNNQKHADQQRTAAAISNTTTITTTTTNAAVAATGPAIVSASPSAAAAIALWQAKNSHLFQAGGYPKDSTAMRPQTPTRRVFSTQPKPSVRLPGLMDREIKMGLSAAADMQRIEAKENSFGASAAAGAATINEEKRMMLPAWIREGLEKMEREKQQKLKREQEYRQREEKLSSQQHLHTLALSPTREELIPPLSVQQQVEEEPQAPHQATVPVKEQDIEQTTKKILTEVFMETTNEVLLSIAKEELSKVQKRKAKQAATSNVGRATYTRGLGLGIYGDSDDDDDEEDEAEEDQPANETSKTAPAAGTCVNSDLDSANNSDDDDSDTEAMRKMMDKIRSRQQSFKSTASQIEQWIGEVSDTVPNSTEPKQKVQPSDTEGSDEEEADADEARYDAADSDPERESPPRPGKVSTGNGFGTAQYIPFTARQTDKASGSQENVIRKRRDKRVSRFSDPRDTVRTTHVTHVSILSNPVETVRPGTKAVEPSPPANVAPAPVSASTVRPKQVAPEVKPRPQSINAYMQQLHSYQTIYSISAGHRAAQSKATTESDDTRRKHNAESEASVGSDGGEPERKPQQQYYHDRKRSSFAEDNDSGTSRSRRDEGGDGYRKRYRDRSHSRSSRGSSASRSGSPDSRSSRSTLSPNSHASERRRGSSSSKRSRYHRDRSADRRSRSSGSSSRRHHRSKHSRSPSRSRSSSKYSSHRRF